MSDFNDASYQHGYVDGAESRNEYIQQLTKERDKALAAIEMILQKDSSDGTEESIIMEIFDICGEALAQKDKT